MGETTSASDEGPYNLRSDGEPGIHGYLGDFRRDPAVFTLYEIPPDRGRYPNGPTVYLLDVDDGAGARECCRLTDDPGDRPVWNRNWKGDEWGPWIMERIEALIEHPQRD
jgi:hypothetical protein